MRLCRPATRATQRVLIATPVSSLFEDEGFDEIWAALRERVPASSNTVFVTATLAPWVVSAIQRDLPLVKLLKGKTLHKARHCAAYPSNRLIRSRLLSLPTDSCRR